MTCRLPEALGTPELRDRLRRLLDTDAAPGIAVLEELRLENEIRSLRAKLKELQSALERSENALGALRDQMPRFDDAGIAVSLARAFVRDCVGGDEFASAAPITSHARGTPPTNRREFAIVLRDLVRYGL